MINRNLTNLTKQEKQQKQLSEGELGRLAGGVSNQQCIYYASSCTKECSQRNFTGLCIVNMAGTHVPCACSTYGTPLGPVTPLPTLPPPRTPRTK